MTKPKQVKEDLDSSLASGKEDASQDSGVVTYSRKRKAATDEGADIGSAKLVKKEEEPPVAAYDWPVSAYGSGREAARLAMQRVREQASASKKGKKPAPKHQAGTATDLQSRFMEQDVQKEATPLDSGGDYGTPEGSWGEGTLEKSGGNPGGKEEKSDLGHQESGAEREAGKKKPAASAKGKKEDDAAKEGTRRTRASAVAAALESKPRVGTEAGSKKGQPAGPVESQSPRLRSAASPKGGTADVAVRGLSPRLALKRCGFAKSPKGASSSTPKTGEAAAGEMEGSKDLVVEGREQLLKAAKIEPDAHAKSEPSEDKSLPAGTEGVKGETSPDDVIVAELGRPLSATDRREMRQSRVPGGESPSSGAEEVIFEREVLTPREPQKGQPTEGDRPSLGGDDQGELTAMHDGETEEPAVAKGEVQEEGQTVPVGAQDLEEMEGATPKSPGPEEKQSVAGGEAASKSCAPARLTRQQLRQKEGEKNGGATTPLVVASLADAALVEESGVKEPTEEEGLGESPRSEVQVGAEEEMTSQGAQMWKLEKEKDEGGPPETEVANGEGAGAVEVKAAVGNQATCPICLRTFKSNKAMYGHQRTHDKSASRKKVEKKESGPVVVKAPEKRQVREVKKEKASGPATKPGWKEPEVLDVKADVAAKASADVGESGEPRKVKKQSGQLGKMQKEAGKAQKDSGQLGKVQKASGQLGNVQKKSGEPGKVQKESGEPGKVKKGSALLEKVKKLKGALKPGGEKLKGLGVTFVRPKVGNGVTCPICRRVFKSDKAMHGHQRSHTSDLGVAVKPKAPPDSGKNQVLKNVLKKLLKKEKASASVPKPKKVEKPEPGGQAGAADQATCPICLRTFGSNKAMYGHQRTHDLDERSGLKLPAKQKAEAKGAGILRKIKQAKAGSLAVLGKKKESRAASVVAPGIMVRKKLPGPGTGPSIGVSRRKKGLQQSMLLARRKRLAESGPAAEAGDPPRDVSEPRDGTPREEVSKPSLEKTETNTDGPAASPGSVPTCPICKRTFMSNKAMYGHQRTHGGGLAPVQLKKKVRPLLAPGIKKKKKVVVPLGAEEQPRVDRLRSRAKGEGLSVDEVATGEGSVGIRPRSGRLPVFEALGGLGSDRILEAQTTGLRSSSKRPSADFRGPAMQGSICHQGRPRPPPLGTIVTAEDVLARFGGHSVKGVMPNPTAGSVVAPCLECGAGCYSEGRAWLRCQGGCARYIHQKCTARPRMKGPPGEGFFYSCWDCRKCHSCGVRLLDAPEAGQHKERQYTLCPPCAMLWSMHNYCTACEKVGNPVRFLVLYFFGAFDWALA
jgi:hypothetical protein